MLDLFHRATALLRFVDPGSVIAGATIDELDEVASVALELARHLHAIGTAATAAAQRPTLQVVS